MALLRRKFRRVIAIVFEASSVALEIGRHDDEPHGAAELLFVHASVHVADDPRANLLLEWPRQQRVRQVVDRELRAR